MVCVVVVSKTVDIDLNAPHMVVALLITFFVIRIVHERVQNDLSRGAATVHEYIEETTVRKRNETGLLTNDEGCVFEEKVDAFDVDTSGSGVFGVEAVVVGEFCSGEGFENGVIGDKVFFETPISTDLW